MHFGVMRDYLYLFEVNKYAKPAQFYWPVLSLWWSIHGSLWVDRMLVPLAGIGMVGALLAWRTGGARRLRRDPAFGASVLAVGGYLLFMTYQNHPQPRYYAVVAFFVFFVLCMAIEVLVVPLSTGRLAHVEEGSGVPPGRMGEPSGWRPRGAAVRLGIGLGAATVTVAILNAVQTVGYAVHPEYTYVRAAERLTHYIDEHPHGKRLLLSISGDEITMMTHLPSICDDFGTQDLVSKLAVYQPGWFATWNDLDPGTLEDLHSRFALEQVATFHALDDPDRNALVLFKLNPLPAGTVREPDAQNLQVVLPEDRIDIPIE
jgi:hypothetical protein